MSASRRLFLSSCLALAAIDEAVALSATTDLDLTYAAGRLSWPGGSAPAACGRGGVRADKCEGDGASPAGTFPLVRVFYRPDRGAVPLSRLPVAALHPEDGWVDQPGDPQYNRLVSLPYPASHEEMWRADELYDLVVVIGYNTDAPVTGRGSAIFLHIARPGLSPTEGCIAVARDVLAGLLPGLGPNSTITIRS